jgi:hypothetical protein
MTEKNEQKVEAVAEVVERPYGYGVEWLVSPRPPTGTRLYTTPPLDALMALRFLESTMRAASPQGEGWANQLAATIKAMGGGNG